MNTTNERLEFDGEWVKAIGYTPYAKDLKIAEGERAGQFPSDHDNVRDLGDGWFETRYRRSEVVLVEDLLDLPTLEESADGMAAVMQMLEDPMEIRRRVLLKVLNPTGAVLEEKQTTRLERLAASAILLSITGFSQHGRAYELGNQALATEWVKKVRAGFPEAIPFFTTGGSYTGVDRGLKDAGRENGVAMIDVTCPEYAPWVQMKRKRKILLLARSVTQFKLLLTACTDVQMVTGGRQNALDVACEFVRVRHRPVGVFPIVPTLTLTGAVPSLEFLPGNRTKVLDAAVLLNENILIPGAVPVIRDLDELIAQALRLMKRPVQQLLLRTRPEAAIGVQPVYVEDGLDAGDESNNREEV